MTVVRSLEGWLWPEAAAKFSAFSFAFGQAGELPEVGCGGRLNSNPTAAGVTVETRFDIASLTKLFTATLTSMLASEGQIDLDAPISDWMQIEGLLGTTTARELLTHSSGLPAEWEEQDTRSRTIDSLLAVVPDHSQKGKLVYSCTGYSLLAVGIERLTGERFDQVLGRKLLKPLGLSETGYLPSEATTNIATSCTPEEGFEAGTVHDPRARALDGISGNAGLFSTAGDLFKFLSEVVTGRSGIIDAQVRADLFKPVVSGEWEQSIGFRFRDFARLGSNSHFFSHTGFTGTLAMVNPETKQLAVLLTNRLVCGTSREQMASVYREFSERVFQ